MDADSRRVALWLMNGEIAKILPPALMSPLEFVAFEVGPGPLSSKRIKELMNQKLKIGADGDGLEDRLISVAHYNIGGTWRIYYTYTVSKKKAKQPSLTVSDFTAFTPKAL